MAEAGGTTSSCLRGAGGGRSAVLGRRWVDVWCVVALCVVAAGCGGADPPDGADGGAAGAPPAGAVSSPAGSESASEATGAAGAESSAGDPQGPPAAAQPEAEAVPGSDSGLEAGDLGPYGEADSVPICRLRGIEQSLPQGHGGSGFDGRGAGMVEVFAGAYRGPGSESALEPVQLVPESALSGWVERPVVEGYVLELLDRDGAVVHAEPVRGRLREDPLLLQWEMHIADRPAFEGYRIRHDGRSIVEASASAGPPQLGGLRADLSEALRDPGGYRLPGVLFYWTACDPDADTLYQYTYYSSDRAAGYQLVDDTVTLHRPDDPTTTTIIYDDPFVPYSVPLSVRDAADTFRPRRYTHDADTSRPGRYLHAERPWNLPEGEQAHFVVVVSDGLRWSAAKSPPFEPAPHPAVIVSLRAPRGGDVYGPADEILLIGSASGVFDRAWWDLPHDIFRWSSDIDGEFTPKPSTEPYESSHLFGRIPEGFLSPGIHRITATATDEAGNTGSATVTIEVRP